MFIVAMGCGWIISRVYNTLTETYQSFLKNESERTEMCLKTVTEAKQSIIDSEKKLFEQVQTEMKKQADKLKLEQDSVDTRIRKVLDLYLSSSGSYRTFSGLCDEKELKEMYQEESLLVRELDLIPIQNNGLPVVREPDLIPIKIDGVSVEPNKNLPDVAVHSFNESGTLAGTLVF